MKKTIKIIIYIFLIFFLALFLCEFYFFSQEKLNKIFIIKNHIKRTVSYRARKEWFLKQKKDFFSPPFLIFSNTEINNSKRLQFIYEKNRPPSGSFNVIDFLQNPNRGNARLYSVTINSMGFRDPPRKNQKSSNSFRIICLGSYHTYGLSVGNNETFPYHLEKQLNIKSKSRIFEAWNAGLPASTAIVGLARLKYQLLDLKPDLIVLDYGWLDDVVTHDNRLWGAPLSLSKKDSANLLEKTFIFLVTNKYLNSLRFFKKTIEKMSSSLRKEYNSIPNWLDAMKKILEICQDKKIPVILISQDIYVLPINLYSNLTTLYENTHHIDISSIFRETPIPQEILHDFHKNPSWVSEFEDKFVDLKKYAPFVFLWKPENQGTSLYNSAPYYTNLVQYSSLGHALIAENIAKKIINIINEKSK